MRASHKAILLCLAATAIVCPRARAQSLDGTAAKWIKDVDRGNKIGGLGARLGLFLTSTDHFASGLEVGYAGLGSFQSELELGRHHEESELLLSRTDRKLWYATVTVRRRWMVLGPNTGLYAGGGTGLYYLRTKSEALDESGDPLSVRMMFQERSGGSAHLGMNVGGGWTIHNHGPLPGSIDFDVRLHVLPFSAVTGVRTLLTFSAGLNLF